VRYKLSRQAEEDIVELYLAGAAGFGVTQAERYHEGLKATLEFLAEYPMAARERTEISPPVRVHPYRAHLVVYRIEGHDILIIRLRHGHENWQASPASD
jgi:toxin ParE1/3/4